MSQPIRRALGFVSDKTGIVELGRDLAARGVEILSTGGSAGAAGRRHRRRRGVRLHRLSRDHGRPGQDPAARSRRSAGVRGDPEHEAAMQEPRHRPDRPAGGQPLSVRQRRHPGAGFDDCIENIDIGGPGADPGGGEKPRLRHRHRRSGQLRPARRTRSTRTAPPATASAANSPLQAYARTGAYERGHRRLVQR